MRWARLPRVWTQLNFSVKFAAIIAVAGVLIAIIPLSLAGNENRNQATQRATDKAGIVVNLVAGQRDRSPRSPRRCHRSWPSR